MPLIRDQTIRLIESITATNRVGRVIPPVTNPFRSEPSIMVFAAHPDDDVLGVGITMYRHVLSEYDVQVIFTSNGGGHHRSRLDLSKEAKTRYAEACAALAQVGIASRHVGCLGFPDGRLYRYMNDMAYDVRWLIEQTRPSRIYVHSIEGGHRDHDITGFVVQSVCKHIGYSEVYEWTEYNSLQTLRDDPVDFPSYPHEVPFESMRLLFTSDERALKQSMLMAHSSQVTPMKLKEYIGRSELVRRCNLVNITKKLNYFWDYSISIDRLGPLIGDLELFLNDRPHA